MVKIALITREVRRRLRPLRDLPRYRIARFDPAWSRPADANVRDGVSDVVLITCGFGAERYARAARRLAAQATRSGFFTRVMAFTAIADVPGLERKDRRACEELARRYPRGYGLWAWKPSVIAAVMRELPEGAAVFYIDAGCEISAWGRDRFDCHVARLRDRGHLFFAIPQQEREWTASSVLTHFGLPADERSDQIQATWFAVINNGAWRDFMHLWADACIANNAHLLHPAPVRGDASLIEHREDQSLLSCMLKRRTGTEADRWEDHFVPELYRPDTWILLMPIHTLRNDGELSRIDPLLNVSDRVACLRHATGSQPMPASALTRMVMRTMREWAYCIREAVRGTRRILCESRGEA